MFSTQRNELIVNKCLKFEIYVLMLVENQICFPLLIVMELTFDVTY